MQAQILSINNPGISNSRLLVKRAKVDGLDKRYESYGFREFELTNYNREQYEICKNWNETESIILTGKTGTGKTRLAIAMLKNMKMRELPEIEAAKEKRRLEYDLKIAEDKEHINKILDSELYKYRPARGLFKSVVEMFIEINDTAIKGGKQELLDQYAKDNFDCICFDDLGAEKLTDAKRENLYYIIDSRYRNMLPTIITTNFTINEINNNEPRIASRLSEMGKIIVFNGPDYRLN